MGNEEMLECFRMIGIVAAVIILLFITIAGACVLIEFIVDVISKVKFRNRLEEIELKQCQHDRKLDKLVRKVGM